MTQPVFIPIRSVVYFLHRLPSGLYQMTALAILDVSNNLLTGENAPPKGCSYGCMCWYAWSGMQGCHSCHQSGVYYICFHACAAGRQQLHRHAYLLPYLGWLDPTAFFSASCSLSPRPLLSSPHAHSPPCHLSQAVLHQTPAPPVAYSYHSLHAASSTLPPRPICVGLLSALPHTFLPPIM